MNNNSGNPFQVIKIMRPVMEKGHGLVIYSEDGIVPISVIPDEGEFKNRLGKRNKAWFKYKLDKGKIILGEEIIRGKA